MLRNDLDLSIPDLSACGTTCTDAGEPDGGSDLGRDMMPRCTPATVAAACTDPAEPVCAEDGGTCRACASASDDSMCGNQSAATPRCDNFSGRCVACRPGTESTDCTVSTSPICDATGNTCRPCKTHAECPSFGAWPEADATTGVCTATGACAPASQVLFVDNRGSAMCTTNNPTRDGTLAHPFCEITEALPSPKPYVLVRQSSQTYGSLNIPNSANLTVAIIGPGLSASPAATISPGATNTPAINIATDSTHSLDVTIDGFTVAGAGGTANAHGIACTGAAPTTLTKLRVLRSVIQANVQLGITASACDVTADQVIVGPTGVALANSGGGVSLTNCTYGLKNMLIHHNGNGTSATKGLFLSGSGNAANRVVNLTIADNQSDGTAGAGIFCGETTAPTLFNLALNGNTAPDQTACSMTTSAFNGGTGSNQNTSGCASGDLFVGPTMLNGYNYAPKVPAGGTCTVTLPNMGTAAGSPDHDLKGAPRPQPAASKPDIGAYEVP